MVLATEAEAPLMLDILHTRSVIEKNMGSLFKKLKNAIEQKLLIFF